MDSLLLRGQADSAGIRRRIGQAQGYGTKILSSRLDASGEGRNGRRIEYVLERDIDAKVRPEARKHLCHRERIRAEREDVLVDTDLTDFQKVRPGLGQLPLHFRAGRNQLAVEFHRRGWQRDG